MMKKLLIAAAALLLIAGTIQPVQARDKAEFELNFNLPIPPNHTRWQKALKGWCEEIETRSNGRIKIYPYFSEALSRQAEAFESVQSGVADLTESTFNSGNGAFPAHEAMFTLLKPSRALENPSAFMNALHEAFPQMKDELKGTKLLFMHAHPVALMIGVNKPVKSFAELSGRKISALGTAVMTKKLVSMGFSPTQLMSSEEFMAMQQGVVDGNMIEFDQLISRRYGEVVKQMVLINLGTTAFFCVMNQDVYDSMPADLREVIDSVSGEYAEKMMEEFWNNQEFESLDKWIREYGGSLYMLTDEEYAEVDKAMESAKDIWMESLRDAGYDADRFLKVIRDLEEEYNKDWKDYRTAPFVEKQRG